LDPIPPPRQGNGRTADWLLFLLVVAILVIGASAFAIGFVLIAAAP